MLLDASSVSRSQVIGRELKAQWAGVKDGVGPLAGFFRQALPFALGKKEDLLTLATRAIGVHNPKLAVELFCASTPLGPTSASTLRDLLAEASQDAWLTHFISAAAEDGAKITHVKLVLAERAHFAPETFLRFVCRLCCTGADKAYLVAELARLDPAVVQLDALTQDSGELDEVCAIWLLQNLERRNDRAAAEKALSVMIERLLCANPLPVAFKLLAEAPLRVQVMPNVVAKLAMTQGPVELASWLRRVLKEEPLLLPVTLPAPMLRSEEVIDVLIASGEVKAQIQGLTALASLEGRSGAIRIQQVLKETPSLLVAQLSRDLLATLDKPGAS